MAEDMIRQNPPRGQHAQPTGGGATGLNPRAAQMQLLSRALAHVAHDVQNHLAIIDESAGWMKDLLKIKGKHWVGRIVRLFDRDRSARLDTGPILRALDDIHEQMAQASGLNQRFSRFAHLLEEDMAIFDANRVLGEIEDVFARQVLKKELNLEMKLGTGVGPMIETDPSGFLLAASVNLDDFTEGLKSGDRVTLETEVREGRFHLSLTSTLRKDFREVPAHRGPDAHDFPQNLVERLGGQILRRSGDGTRVRTLNFPLAKSGALSFFFGDRSAKVW
jgi:hypothetical protein